MKPQSFANRLLKWYKQYGRHNLPWQKNPTPYRVWVSEIMLQQTQVATVIPYYQRFMKRFPTLKALAAAKLDEVLSYWSGLGYYARARHLYEAAQCICKQYGGHFPKTIEQLSKLPGIGRSTAGAILSFAMNKKATILDGNVKRILCRFHAISEWPGKTRVQKQLWLLAEIYTPKHQVQNYNQAIIDLGATVCVRTNPHCECCPIYTGCQAYRIGQQNKFPVSKTALYKPTKETVMLIMQNANNEILLEKRPPIGIWGGLWSFPECRPDVDITAWCRKKYQCKIIRSKILANFSHQFSHFTLEIKPIHLHVISSTSSISIMDSFDRIWYNRNNQFPGGKAAPITRLMKQILLEVST